MPEMMKLICECGAKLKARRESAGKEFTCPECSETVRVPTTELVSDVRDARQRRHQVRSYASMVQLTVNVVTIIVGLILTVAILGALGMIVLDPDTLLPGLAVALPSLVCLALFVLARAVLRMFAGGVELLCDMHEEQTQ